MPAYILTAAPAPYFWRYERRAGVAAFVDGVTAAAIGALSGAVVVLGRRSIVDVPTAIVAVAAILLLWKWKLPEPLIIGGAGPQRCGVDGRELELSLELRLRP